MQILTGEPYPLGASFTGAGTNFSVSAALVPNKALSVTTSYSYTSSSIGGGQTAQGQTFGRVDGSFSFTPFPALYFAGTASRYVSGLPPTVLLSFSGGFSPFPGGDLMLRFAYAETRDEASNSQTRSYGPGARWNIRTGTYLDLGYTVTHTQTGAIATDSNAFIASLVISIR